MLDLNGAVEQDFPLALEPGPDGTVTPPARDPQRAGYRFAGWFTDSAGEIPFDFANTVVTELIEVYAKWEAISWGLTFWLNDGTGEQFAAQSVLDDFYARWPTPPSRAGYGFAGWFTDAEGTPDAAFTFDLPVTLDKDLYAKWDAENYYIHYSRNYAEGAIESLPVSFGATLLPEALPAPQREGYAFGGWYERPECDEEASWTGGVINADKTVYAKWMAQTYTVIFDAEGGSISGSETVSQQISHGQRAVPPVFSPTNTGNNNFAGWAATAGGDALDFTSDAAIITEDTTFHALWTPLPTYTVTFNAQGGTISGAETLPRTVIHGQRVIPPAAPPMRLGYSFTGWYENATGGAPVDFESAAVITETKTFHAQWKQVFTVTLVNPITQTQVTSMVLSGATYALAKPEEWEGELEGWYDNAAFGNKLHDPTATIAAVTENKTLYARPTAVTVTFTWSDSGSANYIAFKAPVSDPPPLTDSDSRFGGITGSLAVPKSTYGYTRIITVLSSSTVTLPNMIGLFDSSLLRWRRDASTTYANDNPTIQVFDNMTFTAYRL